MYSSLFVCLYVCLQDDIQPPRTQGECFQESLGPICESRVKFFSVFVLLGLFSNFSIHVIISNLKLITEGKISDIVP